ncbi:MAG: molybdate ABC transporter permease subunit [Planctomycetota bacterium]|nr:molybdate ABC transporter permease subunit [Planctomycetota bacterium]
MSSAWKLVALLAILSAGAGCRNRTDASGPLVFVAASFERAIAAVDTPVALRVQSASSSVLARQIANGAKPSCFVSANLKWMDFVENTGLIESGSRRTLVGNRLALVVPKSNQSAWSAEGFDGRFVVGDPSHVPVGSYAKQALVKQGWWDNLADHLVLAPDASTALRFVERGEVDAAVVYETDAIASDQVRIVHTFVDSAVQYQIAGLRDGDERVQGWLMSPQAMAAYTELGFSIPPSAAIAATAFERRAPTAPVSTRSALSLSLFVGMIATLLGLLPAMGLAHWLVRSESPLRPVVEAVVILPMVLPPVVVGYFLLVLFGREGLLGSVLSDWFGLQLAFQWQGAALAALVMGFPLMVRTMRQAFENVDPGLEEAAATLGASRWSVFRRVSVPLAARGLVAGAALCFARSLGEFGATITFAGNVPGETRTLPLAIWTALSRVDGESAAWELTWLCVGVSISATMLCEFLVRRPRRSVI